MFPKRHIYIYIYISNSTSKQKILSVVEYPFLNPAWAFGIMSTKSAYFVSLLLRIDVKTLLVRENKVITHWPWLNIQCSFFQINVFIIKLFILDFNPQYVIVDSYADHCWKFFLSGSEHVARFLCQQFQPGFFELCFRGTTVYR
jgi:hypothetical protein